MKKKISFIWNRICRYLNKHLGLFDRKKLYKDDYNEVSLILGDYLYQCVVDNNFKIGKLLNLGKNKLLLSFISGEMYPNMYSSFENWKICKQVAEKAA